MAQNEAPIGSQEDFQHLTPFEREKRDALQRQLGAPDETTAADQAFRREMAELDATRARRLEEYNRSRGAETSSPAAAAPVQTQAVKLFHLLCAKNKDNKIWVVGIYSSREAMADGIAQGIASYSAAGLKFGTIEFDLNVAVDSAPTAL